MLFTLHTNASEQLPLSLQKNLLIQCRPPRPPQSLSRGMNAKSYAQVMNKFH